MPARTDRDIRSKAMGKCKWFGAITFTVALTVLANNGTLGASSEGVDHQAQSGTDKPSRRPAPRDVGLCELMTNAKQFDRQRVRITAFIDFGFEHFTLSDPSCSKDSGYSFWIAYGGNVASGAIYCCPGEGGAGQSKPSADAAFPLIDNRAFKDFRALLAAEGDTTVRVTVVGTVLPKPDREPGNPLSAMRGYGHMGCCSLFVLEQVEQFEPHKRKDLDYRSSGGFYDHRSCWSSGWKWEGDWTEQQAILEQRAADAGDRRWAFSDPRRVALEALRKTYGDQVSSVTLVKTTPTTQAFEWRHDRKWSTAVVRRPYWLSFFAKTKEVVWTASDLTTDGCDVEIRPDGDIRTQVMTAFSEAFEAVDDVRLPPEMFTTGRVEGPAGPSPARFFEVINSYAVALATDERGWPSWVDVRPKSRYPVPAEVWPPLFVGPDANVPMPRYYYDQFIAFIDAVSPFGSPVGKVKKSGQIRSQSYEHATITWEDGSQGQNSFPGAVRAFSVKWKPGPKAFLPRN